LLYPWFITGFADAESSFIVSITKDKKHKTGYKIILCFSISLSEKDKALLENIQTFFGVGKIYKHSQNSYIYKVQSIKDLQVIIVYFDKYPLITKKRADYLLFKQIIELMQKKEHLTVAGLREIVAIKASLNLGLSPEIKVAFPEIIHIARPLVLDNRITDPI
jgi:hypothetical protein